MHVLCQAADVREIEDNSVEAALFDGFASAACATCAEFGCIHAIENTGLTAVLHSFEGPDVRGCLGVFREGDGVCVEGCGE